MVKYGETFYRHHTALIPAVQATAHPRHEEEEETDKTKQAQIEQSYKKH